MLTGLEEQKKFAQNDLDIAVKSIDDIFIASAECSFWYLDNRIKSALSNKKPSWYGPQCKLIGRKWHNAKYLNKFNKSDNNKLILKQASKTYKKTMRKKYVKFKKYQVRKLKELKYKNPKTYWKILRGRTHGAGCVRRWFRTAEPLGERPYENWNTHIHIHTENLKKGINRKL